MIPRPVRSLYTKLDQRWYSQGGRPGVMQILNHTIHESKVHVPSDGRCNFTTFSSSSFGGCRPLLYQVDDCMWDGWLASQTKYGHRFPVRKAQSVVHPGWMTRSVPGTHPKSSCLRVEGAVTQRSRCAPLGGGDLILVGGMPSGSESKCRCIDLDPEPKPARTPSDHE